MGMDWHSSGITTSVVGALKRGLGPLSGELGLHVCGGRGKHSRATPGELIAVGDKVGLRRRRRWREASRLVAKVDSAAVQDGFELYLHGFIVADDGKWVVVQQGMNGDRRQARRYHWLSEGLTSFVDAPHAAIEGRGQGEIVNLTDRRAARSRAAQVELLGSLGPERIAARAGSRCSRPTRRQPARAAASDDARPSRRPRGERRHAAPARRARRGGRARAGRLYGLAADVPASARAPCRRWRMVAEVVHGAPCRFSDPARFSLALAARTATRFRCRPEGLRPDHRTS